MGKMKKNRLIGILALSAALFLSLGFFACATTEPPAPEPEKPAVVEEETLPDWALVPPVEEGAIYGLGSDRDPQKARLRSLADIAWQLGAQVNSLSVEGSTADGETRESVAASLGEQMAAVSVDGAAIVETYESSSGETWVLSRKSLGCVLDVAESLLTVYALDLGMEAGDAEMLISEMEARLIAERVENPGLENPSEVGERVASVAAGRLESPKRETLEEIAERAGTSN